MMTMPYRYAYLGPAGTFSEAAVKALGHEQAQAVPFTTIQAAMEAVRGGALQRAVVPIENSVEGAVTATLDELAAGQDLVICAEVLLDVAFALLVRPGTQMSDIKLVGGHPVAQPQCRKWLAANLPDADWRPALSNAEAARQVADGQLDAALAGAFTADVYHLAVLARDIHDRESAVTRFVVVRLPGPLPPVTGADRTSVIAFLADDHPGALMEILSQFAVREVNLTRIESRPTGEGLGRYCFFIDCEGHVDEARVGEALMGLRRICSEVRFLGSYPRSDGGRTQVRAGTSDAAFADADAWLTRLRDGRTAS
jgi:prephenate dehydratase